MASVLPTLREKKRYLVFEVIGDANCNTAVTTLKNSFSGFFGVMETAKAAITPVKSSGKRCMLSVNRKYVDKLKSTLAMVKKINNKSIILRSIGVSGALNAAASNFMNERSVI